MMDDVACGVDQLETGGGRDFQFAHASEVKADHGDLLVTGHVAALIDMNGGRETLRFEARVEMSGGFGPERGIGISDGNSLPFLNGLGKLEVEMVCDAEVALAICGVERAALEADALDGNRSVVGLYRKFSR